jgi:hypothetical protein
MTTRRMWAFQMLSLVLALLIAPAAAAQRLSDLDDMDRQVTCGQQVVVTESNGQRVKGRVTGVDGSTLTLLVDEGFDQRSVTLTTRTISTIREKDSLLNGLLIGLGSGLVGAEVWIYRMCGPPGYDPECRSIATAIGWAAFGGGGAVIGTLIDKFTMKVIYSSPHRARLHVQPMLGARTQGLRLSLTF